MADEADKTKKTEKAAAKAPAKSGKSSLIRYLVFGAAGVVVVLIVAFGTLMLIGTGQPIPGPSTQPAPSEAAGAATNSQSTGADSSADVFDEDSLMASLEQDESVLQTILASLDALDYVPDEKDLTQDSEGMSVEDSIEAVNWLELEKSKLDERQRELNAREKRLNVLDSRIQQKILVIEQAESVRITKLAKLYDGMEAGAVAKLVANLDDETVVSLLPRMKLKNASAVLSLMPPARAARLSKQMITIAEN